MRNSGETWEEYSKKKEQGYRDSIEQQKPKSWGQQAKSLGSSILSSVGNAAINAAGNIFCSPHSSSI